MGDKVEVVGTNGMVVTNLPYIIHNPLLKRDLRVNNKGEWACAYSTPGGYNLHGGLIVWEFRSLGNGEYAIYHPGSDRYLRSNNKGDWNSAYSVNGGFNVHGGYVSWKISSLGNGEYVIHCPSMDRYLRANKSGDWAEVHSATGGYNVHGGYAAWRIIPNIAYKLKNVTTDFDFGPSLKEKLMASAKPDFSSVQEIVVKHANLGSKIGGTYTKTIEENFTWGLNQTIGISVEKSIKFGVPSVAQASVTVTGSFEFGSSQEWSATKSTSFSATVEMSPSEPGVYRLGNIIYVADDISLPFTAKSMLTATSEGKQLPANVVESLFRYEGLDATIVERGSDYIRVDVTGNFKASYSVFQQAVFEKISDL